MGESQGGQAVSVDEIMLNRLWIQRDDLLKENERLEDRIKRLEKAGDKMHNWLMSKNRIGCDMEIASEWTRAKKNKS